MPAPGRQRQEDHFEASLGLPGNFRADDGMHKALGLISFAAKREKSLSCFTIQ